MEDKTLIQNIQKEDCEESLKELIQKHEGLIRHMSQKYAAADGSPRAVALRQEEVWDSRFSLVYDAARNFDASRNVKFSTWLGSQVRYHCLNHIKKDSRYVTCDDETMDSFVEKHGIQERNDRSGEMEYVLNLLAQSNDDRLKRIISMRYLSGGTKLRAFSSIARLMNMSAQGVIDIHNRFILLVQKKIKSTKISDII